MLRLICLAVGLWTGCALGQTDPAGSAPPARLPAAALATARAASASVSATTRTKADFWVRRAARDPSDPIARLQAGYALAQLARESGDHSVNRSAEDYFRQTLALGADNYQALVGLAFTLLAQHRFADARTIAARARDVDPHATAAWAALGDAALELGDLEVAETAYGRLLANDRGVFSLVRQANLAIARGQRDAAVAALDEAARVGIDRGANLVEVARCLVLAGDADFQRGRFTEAETRYQRALELWPQGYLPLEHLAELRAAQGRLDESRGYYQRIDNLAAHPDLAEAWGDVERQLGNAPLADELLGQALAGYHTAAQAGDPSYFRHLALFLAGRLDKPGEALNWAAKDVEARPLAESWALLAWVRQRAGDLDGALTAMDQALASPLALGPDALQRGAGIYRAAGDPARARELLHRALALRGQHPARAAIEAALQDLTAGG